MSAIRYSGNVRIRVTYVDPNPRDAYADGTPRYPNGSYRCALSLDSAVGVKDRASVIVGAPAFLSDAVDSPEAFDDAASAAVAFAERDNSTFGESAAYNDSGVHVGRSPREAYPVTPRGMVSILSIDAWNSPEGWTWNAWYKVGSVDASICDRPTRAILAYLRKEGFLSEASRGRVAVEDDQYNVVILDKGTREPLFAIAYGEVQS